MIFALTSCKKDEEEVSYKFDELKDKATYKVGILQYVTHGALDLATQGIKEHLTELLAKDGKTVEFVVKNPETDPTALTSMAYQLVEECDIVVGNATPAATALKGAALNQGKVLPILFTSVTDPKSAELVESNEKPNTYVSGTSDMNPVKEQMDLIFEVDSTVDKIGFLYTSTETNSVAQCELAINYLKNNKGFNDSNILVRTFVEAKDLTTCVNYLIESGCDCIFLPTDNIVATSIPAVTMNTNPNGVFLIGAESSMVENGATFSYSINYFELGKITAQMIYEVIGGADMATLSVRSQTSGFDISYNKEGIKALNLELSQAFINKYQINLD